MRFFLMILTGFTCINSYGQFAVIDDKDGFVNIRRSGEISSKVIDTLTNDHVVWCFEPEGKWLPVDYSKKGISKTGYVYKDRVKFLSTYASLPIGTLNQHTIVHKKDSIKVTIAETAFQAKNNKLLYASSEGFKYISRINGKPFWGTDGNVPSRQYKFIKAEFGIRSVTIPYAALENLFEPSLENSECYYNKQKDILYINSLNSDGAGGYVVIWVIEKGRYKTRFISHGF